MTTDEIRAALAPLLRPRSRGGKATVFGAGSEDLAAGRAYLEALAPGGWMVPTWPEEVGGRSAEADEAARIRAVLAELEAPDLYPYGVGLSLVGPTMLAFATPEQCRRWLPATASGAEIWCQLFSEPDAGSDLAGLATRARRDGDVWLLDGSKVWSSRAHYARWGFLLARTDPDVPKHAGITAFVLDMDAPGVDVRPMVQMNGDRHFNQVFMTATPVPDGHRIGDVGQGWAVAVAMLAHERAALGSGAVGTGSEGTSGRLLRLAGATGRSDDPAVRQRLADLVTRERASRWTAQRAREAARRGRPPGPEGSGAKLAITGLLKDAAELGIDLLGMAGVAGNDDDGWQTTFLTGPSLSIRGGTDEIQRNIVGERALGLPPEPRVDRDVPFSRSRRTGDAPSEDG